MDIMEEEWDILVIVDACRYDYFEKVYRDYLEGTLRKVTSPATRTSDWLRSVFGNEKFEDVVYISGNPYINSQGIELADGFNAKNNFYKVIDVWDYGWNDDLKTVPPEKISKATRMARAKYPNKRLISHFMQPHHPYLSIGPVQKEMANIMSRGKENKKTTNKLRNFLGKYMEKIFGLKKTYKLRKALGLTQKRELETIARKYGNKKLEKLYEKNLRKALEKVSDLVERMPGKMVVTSDHGELLGEDGCYGHLSGHEVLKEVPWFEVKT
ncbi:hypothetical protein AKJ57_03960 [candidate division MSBL1 archaeon SCGC-AAA259A05]|uniref:Sulfatase N-terminal domain-containing protein n=1 Tax=candidate division MSBL1 archaeon SCGC-AAA259A05 TaxID=1698259 RepID=A0A133U956_9EURY|nr:hypothetical protein AKJ57_03960 [candidate division MSBL1 archaeon SCGC-AAA259A05]